MDKHLNKKGFFAYRKLTRAERREFRKTFKLERKEEVKDRKRLGLKSVDGLSHYLRDTYQQPKDFLLFAFSYRDSPQGLQYWYGVQRSLQEKPNFENN